MGFLHFFTRVVIEIWFVIFEVNECFAPGSGFDPVVEL